MVRHLPPVEAEKVRWDAVVKKPKGTNSRGKSNQPTHAHIVLNPSTLRNSIDGSFPHAFRELLPSFFMDLPSIVIVWGDFNEPFWLDLTDTPHILLAREHEFMIDHPTRHGIFETRGWMDVHGLAAFDRFVRSCFLQIGRVIKEARGDGFANGIVIRGIGRHLDFYPFHQSHQLITNISGCPHGTGLDEILVAPLHGEVRFCPVGEDIE